MVEIHIGKNPKYDIRVYIYDSSLLICGITFSPRISPQTITSIVTVHIQKALSRKHIFFNCFFSNPFLIQAPHFHCKKIISIHFLVKVILI
ncbi:hypothetical protein P791_2651 [Enterococcus faecalis NY9]|nr:hypothetical protein P791_2651 [Enterococcus faecalis NY9]